jgi:hypothetical protein
MPRDAFPRKHGKGDIDHQPGIYMKCGTCARDKVFSGDTILPMTANWNSFETLLGLGGGTEGFDVYSNLTAWDHRLSCHTRHSSDWTQTLTRSHDAVLLVILAAVLSRAINGSAAFFATLGGGVVLVLLHRLFAYLAFCSHGFGILVKGEPDIIVRDGQCDFQTMRRNHVSTHDLDEDTRLSARTDDLSTIRLARIERSGDISFIKK